MCAILESGRPDKRRPGHIPWQEPRAFCRHARIKATFPLPLCPQYAALSSGARTRGMKASEKSYRLYSCGRCAQQVRICRDCDRGNRYCAGECAQTARHESLRRAGDCYQLSYRGACKHAARQSAWRLRHTQKVTHQGSQASAVAVIVRSISTTTEGTHADIAFVEPQPHATVLELAERRAHARWPDPYTVPAAPRCCFCGCVLSHFARLGPLRAGP